MRDRGLVIEIYSAFQMNRIEFTRKQHNIFLLSSSARLFLCPIIFLKVCSHHLTNYSTSKILKKTLQKKFKVIGHKNLSKVLFHSTSVTLQGFLEISTYTHPSGDLDLLFSLGTKQLFYDLLVSCHDR